MAASTDDVLELWKDQVDSWLGNISLHAKLCTHAALKDRALLLTVPAAGGLLQKIAPTKEKFEVGFIIASFHQRGFSESIKPIVDAMLQKAKRTVLFVTGFSIDTSTNDESNFSFKDAVCQRNLFRDLARTLRPAAWERTLVVACDYSVSVTQQIVVANFLLNPKSVCRLWTPPTPEVFEKKDRKPEYNEKMAEKKPTKPEYTEKKDKKENRKSLTMETQWEVWVGVVNAIAAKLELPTVEVADGSTESESETEYNGGALTGKGRRIIRLHSPSSLNSVRRLCNYIITAAHHSAVSRGRPVNIALVGPPSGGKSSLIRLWATAMTFHASPKLPVTPLQFHIESTAIGTSFNLTPYVRVWDIHRWVDLLPDTKVQDGLLGTQLSSLLSGCAKLEKHNFANAWNSSSICLAREQDPLLLVDAVLVVIPADWITDDSQYENELKLLAELASLIKQHKENRTAEHKTRLKCAVLVSKIDLAAEHQNQGPTLSLGSKAAKQRDSLRATLNSVADRYLGSLQSWNPYYGSRRVLDPSEKRLGSKEVSLTKIKQKDWSREQQTALVQGIRNFAAILYRTSGKSLGAVEEVPTAETAHKRKDIPSPKLREKPTIENDETFTPTQIRVATNISLEQFEVIAAPKIGSISASFTDDSETKTFNIDPILPPSYIPSMRNSSNSGQFFNDEDRSEESDDREEAFDFWKAKIQRSNAIWRLPDHPFILAPFAVPSAPDGSRFLATEKVGKTKFLGDAIRGKTWDAKTKIHFLEGLAMVIYHLHRYDLVHGALNPRNIRVADSGDPLVNSAQAVRLMNDSSDWRLIDFRTSSRAFVAPELRPTKTFSEFNISIIPTRAGDIWSFGCIMVSVLLGLPELSEPLPTAEGFKDLLGDGSRFPKWIPDLYKSCVTSDLLDRTSAPMFRVYFEFDGDMEAKDDWENLDPWLPREPATEGESSKPSIRKVPSWKRKKSTIDSKKDRSLSAPSSQVASSIEASSSLSSHPNDSVLGSSSAASVVSHKKDHIPSPRVESPRRDVTRKKSMRNSGTTLPKSIPIHSEVAHAVAAAISREQALKKSPRSKSKLENHVEQMIVRVKKEKKSPRANEPESFIENEKPAPKPSKRELTPPRKAEK